MNRLDPGVNRLADTPEAPYYAVIFTSVRTAGDGGYGEAAARMLELAQRQPGFLGVESAREGDLGITVSYWDSLESIEEWKNHAEHLVVQAKGKSDWYESYCLRVALVERSSDFPRG